MRWQQHSATDTNQACCCALLIAQVQVVATDDKCAMLPKLPPRPRGSSSSPSQRLVQATTGLHTAATASLLNPSQSFSTLLDPSQPFSTLLDPSSHSFSILLGPSRS